MGDGCRFQPFIFQGVSNNNGGEMVVVSCFVGPRSWRKPGRGSPATAMKDLGRRALELIALVRFRCLLGVKRFRKGVWGSRRFFWGRFFFWFKEKMPFFLWGGEILMGSVFVAVFFFLEKLFFALKHLLFPPFLGGESRHSGEFVFFVFFLYIRSFQVLHGVLPIFYAQS